MIASWKVLAAIFVMFTVALASTGHFAGDLIHYGGHPLVSWAAALGIEVGIAVAMWTVPERRRREQSIGWPMTALAAMTLMSMLANGHHAQVQARAAQPDVSRTELLHVMVLWAALPVLNILLAGIVDIEVEQRVAEQRATEQRIEQESQRRTLAAERRLSRAHEQALRVLEAEREQALADQRAGHEQALAAQRAGHEQRLRLLVSSPPSTSAEQASGSPEQRVSTDALLADIAEHPTSSDAERARRLGCSRPSAQRRRAELARAGRITRDETGAWRVAEEETTHG